MFRVATGSHATKFLRKCAAVVRRRIIRKLHDLGSNPFPPDAKRVVGERFKAFRVRVGDYRVKYVVSHETKEVLVYEIDKRKRAYR